MKNLSKKIAGLLIKKQLTLAIAESCTGGMVSNIFTDIPGSSKFLLVSIIAYNNKFKTLLLKIPEKILMTKGAISKETARGMAENIRKLSRASFGLSVTGLAGPRGATCAKPVGLVYIALSTPRKLISRKFIFKGGRISVKKQAAGKALALLLENL